MKNHLLTAITSSTAMSFVNTQTMDGLEMCYKLLDIFQGQKHEQDKAVNASEVFEKLKFNQATRDSPEMFLASVNECLKRMEVDDGKGGVTRPTSDMLLPSVFRAKINHPAFETWKALSETNEEDWETVQVSCGE